MNAYFYFMNTLNKYIIIIITSFLVASCNQKKSDFESNNQIAEEVTNEKNIHPFTTSIEEKHGAQIWNTKEAVKLDLIVEFGGNTLIDGTLSMLTSTGKTRIDQKDSLNTVAIFDGENSFVSPAASSFAGARFHLLTWPYFLAAPFKLNDPGTELEETGNKDMFGREVPSAKLTFESGIGDTPDDWYVLFKHEENGVLKALAYIVTFGKSTEKASEDPHAVVYNDFQTIEGVTLSKTWDFYGWTDDSGFGDEQIGKVTISNIEFVSASEIDFNVPEDNREEELPSS
ncbi:MAG: heat-shock protein Hsp90 [Bacteroidota bacterium]